MTFSVYDITIPVFQRGFANLASILEKGAVYADTARIDQAELVEARLIEDMLPLSGQIQRASDTAKACVARLAGITAPSFADEEKSFPDLQARIERTLAFLATIDADQLAGAEDRTVTLRTRAGEMSFSGRDYLFQHALPNFFFHVTTAYDILRQKGVPIGKRDYLGF